MVPEVRSKVLQFSLCIESETQDLQQHFLKEQKQMLSNQIQAQIAAAYILSCFDYVC